MFRAILGLCAALALVSCSADAGKIYAVPLQDAHDALQEMDVPPMVFGTEPVEFKVVDSSPNAISWTVGRDGNSIIGFEATLTAVDEKSTRVTVEAHPITEGKTGGDPKALDNVATVLAMYRAAMQERVSSTLEHRRYDFTAIFPYLGAAMATNMGAIRQRIDDENKAYQQNEKDNINKAYAAESSGRYQPSGPAYSQGNETKQVPFGQPDPTMGKPMISTDPESRPDH